MPTSKGVSGKKKQNSLLTHTENKLLFSRNMEGQLLDRESLLWKGQKQLSLPFSLYRGFLLAHYL